MNQLPMPKPAELSKRLRLALDRAQMHRGGETVPFSEVQSFLASKDVSISRSRWAYFLQGSEIQTKDRALLTALSEFLKVPEDYFFTEEISPSLTPDIELVIAMRAAQVQNFAARALGDLAPEALAAISGVLRDIENERAQTPA